MPKQWIFLFVMIAHPVWAAPQEFVDIGFRGLDKHIALELTSLDAEDALRFSLAGNLSQKSVPIAECTYKQSALEREAEQIQDAKIKAEFGWIFFRSDYSSSSVIQFYQEFKALLERVNPQCPVKDLRQLLDQLDSQKG